MTAPTRIVVAKRSARVNIVGSGSELVVAGAPFETAPDGTVTIGGSPAGNVDIRCPEGTDIVIGVQSGRVEAHGKLGVVSVSSTSGRVAIEAARAVDVRTASGRVEIGSADEAVRCSVTSGRITIGHAGSVDVSVTSGRVRVDDTGDARVHAISGRVDVAAGRGSNVEVRTTSGRVSVTLPRGCCPRTRVAVRSGRVDNTVPAGDDGTVDLQTTSGRVSLAWR